MSEKSVVQRHLTDFLQDNGHNASIRLPVLGKSAVNGFGFIVEHVH